MWSTSSRRGLPIAGLNLCTLSLTFPEVAQSKRVRLEWTDGCGLRIDPFATATKMLITLVTAIELFGAVS